MDAISFIDFNFFLLTSIDIQYSILNSLLLNRNHHRTKRERQLQEIKVCLSVIFNFIILLIVPRLSLPCCKEAIVILLIDRGYHIGIFRFRAKLVSRKGIKKRV